MSGQFVNASRHPVVLGDGRPIAVGESFDAELDTHLEGMIEAGVVYDTATDETKGKGK